MSYEAALELADAEISYVRENNGFRNQDLRNIYYNTDGNLVDNTDKFRDLFAKHLQISNSPLMKALA